MNAAVLPDKWFEGLDPAMPVLDAAQRVLEERLSVVTKLARSVVKAKARDDQAVHQFRVATRRAEAAVLSLKLWMREGHRKAARKTLRALRKAAGEVRALDVHCALLRNALEEGAIETGVRGAIEHSLLLWEVQRTVALRELLDSARVARRRLDRLGSRWVRRGTERHMDAAAPPEVRSMGDAALRSLASAFLSMAADDLTIRENLHRLRVQGKRLRYAIEIFGPTSNDPHTLAALNASLVAMQDRLGAVNDFHEISERLAQDAASADRIVAGDDHSMVSCSLSRTIESLSDTYEDRCTDASRSFVEWWQSEESAAFRNAITALAEPGTAVDAAEVPEVVILASSNGTVQASAGETNRTGSDREDPSSPS